MMCRRSVYLNVRSFDNVAEINQSFNTIGVLINLQLQTLFVYRAKESVTDSEKKKALKAKKEAGLELDGM